MDDYDEGYTDATNELASEAGYGKQAGEAEGPRPWDAASAGEESL